MEELTPMETRYSATEMEELYCTAVYSSLIDMGSLLEHGYRKKITFENQPNFSHCKHTINQLEECVIEHNLDYYLFEWIQRLKRRLDTLILRYIRIYENSKDPFFINIANEIKSLLN